MLGVSFVILIYLICSSSCCCTSLFGFVTADKAVISSSGSLEVNGVKIRSDYEFIRSYGDICIGLQGDVSDCEYMFSLIDGYNRQYNLGFGKSLSCKSLGHLCRNIVARELRNRQLNVKGLIAGWDRLSSRPTLYWFDSFGALQKVTHAAHGENFMLLLSQLDHQIVSEVRSKSSLYKGFDYLPDTKIIDVVNECWSCLRKRGIQDLGKIEMRIIGSSGVNRREVMHLSA